MSEDKKLLLKDGRPYRMVPSDITLPEIMDYYKEKLGRKARFMDLSTQEVPEHPDF